MTRHIYFVDNAFMTNLPRWQAQHMEDISVFQSKVDGSSQNNLLAIIIFNTVMYRAYPGVAADRIRQRGSAKCMLSIVIVIITLRRLRAAPSSCSNSWMTVAHAGINNHIPLIRIMNQDFLTWEILIYLEYCNAVWVYHFHFIDPANSITHNRSWQQCWKKPLVISSVLSVHDNRVLTATSVRLAVW